MSLYVPGRMASNRYRPWLSVTVVFEPSIITGLVTSTLTPGSTPPESSVSRPTIALCAEETAGTMNEHGQTEQDPQTESLPHTPTSVVELF